MTVISAYEAHASLTRLIERALAGEDIVITLEGKPMVRLVPVGAEPPAKRQLGQLAGYMTVPNSFFEPLPNDFLDAFYNGPVFPEDSEEGKKERQR